MAPSASTPSAPRTQSEGPSQARKEQSQEPRMEASASTSAAAADQAKVENGAVRSFDLEIPEEALDDLRRRIAATRWPSKELVADRSQGVQLATMQALARYWTTDYDWRKAE